MSNIVTQRRYECDGYVLELIATKNDVTVSVFDPNTREAITIPWSVMLEFCGTVSRWELGSVAKLIRDQSGKLINHPEFP